MRSTGAYVLLVVLEETTDIVAGSVGELRLLPGNYLYCGSAQGGLVPRLARHMRSGKRIHWHVDRLTEVGEVVGALTFHGGKEMECELSALLKRIPGVVPMGHRFGSSDCHCPTHLFRVSDDQLELVLEVLAAIKE